MDPFRLAAARLPQLLQGELDAACTALEENWSAEDIGSLRSTLDTRLEAELAQVLACSPWSLQQFVSRPGLLLDLVESGDLHRRYGGQDWGAAADQRLEGADSEAALATALRRFRCREQCRLIWRDFNRLDDMSGITADLSSLADHCIDAALSYAYTHMCTDLGTPVDADGEPQRLVVLGMGKLGARELNLSSDVDLIFAFPSAGETRGGRRTLDNQQFFVRLAQRVIKLLDAHTGEGFVFRVDMRLRPYGESGALVLSFGAMQEYYHDQGREWERYAMIKARVVAGDREQGARLLQLLRPFVYRRYVDFSAIESLRDMKALIMREVSRLAKQDDVKLGAGGIREVEFIGQVFQLIRGGREPQLQQRSLLVVLSCLAEGGHLPPAVVSELREAYVFLRNTEHAIQGMHDQQTQALPAGDPDQTRLAWLMIEGEWPAFLDLLHRHRERVRRHFEALIAVPENGTERDEVADHWTDLWLGDKPEAEALSWLEAQSYRQPQTILKSLDVLRHSGKVRQMKKLARDRLDAFMPLMLAELAGTRTPDLLYERELPLVEAVLRRTAYLVLLMENTVAREQLHILCAASPWIANQIARHPSLLDELHNVATLYTVPDKAVLRNELREQMLRLEWDDLEGHMETLRYFRLSHVLRVAASEVTERLPLMKVSDYLTYIAEIILEHVLKLAWHNLVARHGVPLRADGSPCELDFIIVGYGKLGGIELGHGSDLDLVFVHDADPNKATNGERPVVGQVFFTRLGQRIIHILTTSTTLGPLYEVDMRLRPSGESGLLVTSLTAYQQYQFNEAWTWEHQALVRARVVSGSAELAAAYEALRCDILAQVRAVDELVVEVRDMRKKMRDNLLPAEARDPEGGLFHLKHSAGGIVDIEFMVQFMVLAWAHQYHELTVWSDNIRILEALAIAGLLTEDEAVGLTGAYKHYRACAHRLSLQQESMVVDARQFADDRALVSRLWRKFMGDDSGDGQVVGQ